MSHRVIQVSKRTRAPCGPEKSRVPVWITRRGLERRELRRVEHVPTVARESRLAHCCRASEREERSHLAITFRLVPQRAEFRRRDDSIVIRMVLVTSNASSESGPLTLAHQLQQPYSYGIMICMKKTLHIDESLLREAKSASGAKTDTDTVRLGLEALVRRGAYERLRALRGSEPHAREIRRRRERATLPKHSPA